jgi:hypothetical protein
MMSAPTIGSTNVPGVILPHDCPGDIEALESLFGQRPADRFNPLIFSIPGGTTLSEGCPVLFDIVASHWDATVGVASNVRPQVGTPPTPPPIHIPVMLRDAHGWALLDANGKPRFE